MSKTKEFIESMPYEWQDALKSMTEVDDEELN